METLMLMLHFLKREPLVFCYFCKSLLMVMIAAQMMITRRETVRQEWKIKS